MASTKRRSEPEDEDDVPVRKKKKKKKKKAAGPNWKLIAGAGGGAVALIIVIFVLVKATGGPSLKPVTNWEKYSTDEAEFGFDMPGETGWKAKGFGKAGQRQVDVTHGGVSVTIVENLMGSLLGNIAGPSGQVPDNDDFLPVAKVHEIRRPKDRPSYQEGPAETVMTRFGKGRRSPTTDGSRRGYRATILMRQTALDVFCECSASEWEVARPIFERMIESIGPGDAIAAP